MSAKVFAAGSRRVANVGLVNFSSFLLIFRGVVKSI